MAEAAAESLKAIFPGVVSHKKTCLLGFLTRSDPRQAVQPKKMTRGLKFLI